MTDAAGHAACKPSIDLATGGPIKAPARYQADPWRRWSTA